MAARARAVLDVRMGHAEAALTRLHPLLDQQGVQEFHVTALLPVLAWAYLEVGDVAQAKQTIEQALRRAQAEHLRLFLVDALHVQALILMQQGRAAAAKTALREALKLARALPWPYAEASLLAVYGRLATELGEHEAAHVALAEALDIFRQLGAQKDTQQAEQLLTMLV